MSYIVLARKYRPQSFSEVYAQDHVTKILESAIASGRIAHAYLFTGPRGVGKTSLARIMAKSLNCVEGPTPKPCNVCTNCTEITAGISPDVIEIDGASNTGVDDIRELQRELMYAASGSKYKIYIIDEVHMLSKSAFNALLKTLEEPPENVIFIFATTEANKVLPTIVSRCQRYDFKRIPIDAIVQRLRDLAKSEEIRVDDESLYLIARKADGGMRDALSLMDQTISYCMNDIKIEQVRQIFGLIPNQVYHDLMQLIAAKDSTALISALHKVFEEGIDLKEFLSNMLEYLRVLVLRQLKVDVKDIAAQELDVFDDIAALFSQNDLMYIIGQLVQNLNDIRLSVNPYLLIESTMIRLSRLDEISEISSLIRDLKEGGNLQASPKVPKTQNKPAAAASVSQTRTQTPKPAPAPAARPAPRAEAPLPHANPQAEASLPQMEFELAALKENWAKLVANVKRSSTLGGLALESAKIVELGESAIVLQLDSPTRLESVKKNQESIEAIFSKAFGKKIHLNLQLFEKEAPTRVDIKRKNIDELKAENPDIASFIDETNARLL